MLLLILAWAFLQTDWGQNWLARQVTGKLSKDLQTKISIRHVSIGFFNRLNLEGVYVEDQKHDTLLYAGAVKVRITDWFFFKDKADLKYIGLEDAAIRLNRTDSVWNYGFLSSYFASTDTTKKKSAGIQFNLKTVDLKNVSFIKKDAWLGSELTGRVRSLTLDADDISASRKTVLIKNLEITDPYFSTLSYEGKRTDTSKTVMDWTVQLANLKITNGRFRQDKNDYTPTVSYFDGNHIDFSKINGSIQNFKLQGDTITGLVNLSTAERSGFVVKKFKTALTINSQNFIFDKLFLQTNRSTLSDYFSLKFSSTKSFSDFVHAVTMNADVKQATISSDDLAFFIPDAKTWKKAIKINGKVEGAVDGLAADNLELWLGNNTYINGNISVIGLPDINNTLLNIDAKDLRTTYSDAVSFFPALARVQTPNVKALSYLRFKGTFTGFVNDFVSYGRIETALGTLTTDINMKLPKTGEPVYTGSVSTDGFQLGTFINNKDLGVVDFHGSIKGRSFDWSKINLNIDGIIHRIKYDNYTYQNIKGKGAINKQQFNGDFTINDPNADLHLNGLIDFSKALPVFDATAQIRKANLKALQLSKEDIQLKGDFNLNLQGNNLANLIGTARISNAELLANGQKLSFDFLDVASYSINNERTLHVSSNEFDGKVTGKFDLATLPSAFRLFLTRYYPAYIKPPTYFTPQDFSFDITTGQVEEYVKLLDKNLSGLNNSHLTGSLNTTANTMTIDADVPAFAYGNYAFSNVNLKGSGDLQKLTLKGSATDANIGGGVLLPETTFSVNVQNDTSDIVINTISNQVVNKASLAARVTTFSDGVSILFSPSNFVVNGKTWTIEQGGELNFRKNSVAQGQLLLKEGEQEIAIQTVPSAEGSWNDLHVALKNLNLSDLSPLLIKDSRLEGTLTGNIIVEDPTGKTSIAADVKGQAIQLDNDSIGNITIHGNYDNVSGMLTARGNNADIEHKIDFDLAMNLKDTANKIQDRISLRPTNFSMKILERFLGTLFTDIQGYTTGNLDILLGGSSNLDLIGKLHLTNVGFKVVFTQVYYKIVDRDIELKKDFLDLDGIVLKDRRGNEAKITGGIKHQGFKNMYFDLAVNTISPQMELINTTYKDNQQFFGHAWGSGNFVLVGEQYDMYMNIGIKASATDSSYVTLPPAQTRESGQAAFLVEKKYGREMNEIEKRGGETNINYEVNLTATPLVNVEVVLDEATGDIIKGRGSGNIKITSGTIAPLKLSGRYNIEDGNYLFTFQSVFKKPFIVLKGANNYIEWNGDPYDGNIHLEAYYTAEKVSFAPLASTLIVDADASRSLARLRDNVNVVATLTGKLFQPTFEFRLEFPSNSQIYSQPSIAFAIQQLQKNTNELTKQVTFLIVTNSFAPYESTQSVGTRPFEEFTYSTVSGLLFNVINKQLNQIFSKIFRNNNNFTLNFSGSLYNRNLLDANARGFRFFNQATVTPSIGYSFFNQRAILSVGGSFEVPVDGSIQQTLQLSPDLSLDILLNQSGSLRATFFYRQNIDYLNGFSTTGSPQRRYGTSLSYNKEFDSFGEFLFGKKKDKDEKKASDSTQLIPTVGAVKEK